MKKNSKKLLIVAIVAVIVIVTFIKLFSDTGYSAAYKNTENLKNYTMNISTIITVNDKEGSKQSAIDKVVKVNNKGKDNMVYTVETTSTTTDFDGKVITEESFYAYKEGKYYNSLPGVNFKSPIDKASALKNLQGEVGIISVPYEKMVDCRKENGEYVFEISQKDASERVNALISSASGQFENTNLSKDALEVTAKVKGKYITNRSFFLSYANNEGQNFVVEIYVDLEKTSADIAEIDDNKYVSIIG